MFWGNLVENGIRISKLNEIKVHDFGKTIKNKVVLQLYVLKY